MARKDDSTTATKVRDADIERRWARIDALPFIQRKGTSRNFWTIEQTPKGPYEASTYEASEDAALSYLKHIAAAGDSYILDRILCDMFGVAHFAPNVTGFGFLRIIERALVFAAGRLDIERWEAALAANRIENRQLVERMRKDAAKQRSERARHARACQLGRAKPKTVAGA